MANPVFGGFRFWGTLSGGQGAFTSTMVREVANNIGTGIFKGDVVSQVSGGTVGAAFQSGDDAGALLGVAIGFSYFPTAPLPGRRPMPYLPASTTFTPSTVGSIQAPWVTIIPFTADAIFSVCGNNAAGSAATAIGYIGKNSDLNVGAGGDTTTGMSTHVLDTNAGHTTGTANFRIIGIDGYPALGNFNPLANDITLTNTRYLVVCNEGFLPPYTATGI